MHFAPRIPSSSARFLQFTIRVAVLILVLQFLSAGPRAEESHATQFDQMDVYQYRMKGNVRLLFFWVGKDDVGGGTIALSESKGPASGDRVRDIEVLFGSTPERVPGGVNRWGYGSERSIWRPDPGPENWVLKETVFEGFMRHSKEDSLGQVQANNDSDRAGNVFLYDGIRSLVQSSLAVSELRVFSADEDFDYRRSEVLQCSYRTRVLSAPPDRVKKVSREPAPPYGFLTAVEKTIDDVRRDFRRNRRKSRVSVDYAYNGNLYRLELTRSKGEDRFELPLPRTEDGSQPAQVFSNVVKAEYRITRLHDGENHEFTIWFPVDGPYAGIPLRIVDKPRWWLRVELNLEPGAEDEAVRSRLQRASDTCN